MINRLITMVLVALGVWIITFGARLESLGLKLLGVAIKNQKEKQSPPCTSLKKV